MNTCLVGKAQPYIHVHGVITISSTTYLYFVHIFVQIMNLKLEAAGAQRSFLFLWQHVIIDLPVCALSNYGY